MTEMEHIERLVKVTEKMIDRIAFLENHANKLEQRVRQLENQNNDEMTKYS